MSWDASTHQPGTSPEVEASVAAVRFRRDQKSSGVSRLGRLLPGGRLRIEYDLSRLLPDETATATDITCHVRFLPSGEVQQGSLLAHQTRMPTSSRSASGPAVFEVGIPLEATAVEVWFERRDADGTSDWDSKYGNNFRFPASNSCQWSLGSAQRRP